MKLFSSYSLGKLKLKNKIVMAPMTRSRAIDNVPNELMATYYAQRASAGLIITEGTSPSPNGLGYPRIPGIFSDEQVQGWKKVTEAVHQKGGHIFIQLMHTGRVTHPANLPSGARSVAPSAIQVSGEMYTDANGMQTMPAPHAMSKEEILQAQDEYVKASTNAIKAGFDGVELHGANGYLLNQFISPISNTRTDEYGGSVENRCRFVIETTQKVVDAIGGQRTGIRVSPYGVFNDMGVFDGIDETYSYLVEKLSDLGLVYLHTVDHSAMGAPEVPESIQATLRKAFNGTFIRSGGLDRERAEALLNEGKADLVAFGRPFISNPDLVTRMEEGLELSNPDHNTFYTPGEAGYTDYAKAKQTT